ncbi:hypothetical protein I314_03805 [Cryptococcus bacillisporus CA1873]|uniref:J domain-containing protein n=1 Tax=Cryptococcus bacillisporus CA1873 TaxID=1296111 RepID=A0ABR5BAB4_CRYGA|nr:hypothetical protein I314_03805 [Cryptococcus bacillisporus CA1873]|eukprot:KIR60509.1 hypothetical protein I314_03805 [Cryptococcus gattii CA1873]
MAPILSEEESALDPYVLLGIEAGATTKDAERAFRKKSLKYHPDKNSAPEAAIIFHQLSLCLGIFQDQAKRNYVDNKLETDRKKKERYAEMDKKRKAMVDALVAREEEAKKQKVEQIKRRQQQADEEAIKDAGRRLLEEAQKRAAAAATATATAQAPKAPETAESKPADRGASDKPIITSEELTLLLTLPASSTITSSDLQTSLTTSYGPVEHVILPPVPSSQQATDGKDGKKKKAKSRKAIVEFASGNWGGCYACWRDHEAGRGMEGVKAKFGTGEVPAWVAWAEMQKPGRRSSPASGGGDQQSYSANGHPPPTTSFTLPTPTSTTPVSAPSFTSAPDFTSANGGGISMADLLAKHAQKKSAKAEEDRRRQEFESMTLSRMRMMEREKLEAEIRRQEEEE